MSFSIIFRESVVRTYSGVLLIFIVCLIPLFTSFYYISFILIILGYLYIQKRYYYFEFSENGVNIIYVLNHKLNRSLLYDEIRKVVVDRSWKLGSQADDFIGISFKESGVIKVSIDGDDMIENKISSLRKIEQLSGKLVVK